MSGIEECSEAALLDAVWAHDLVYDEGIPVRYVELIFKLSLAEIEERATCAHRVISGETDLPTTRPDLGFRACPDCLGAELVVVKHDKGCIHRQWGGVE